MNRSVGSASGVGLILSQYKTFFLGINSDRFGFLLVKVWVINKTALKLKSIIANRIRELILRLDITYNNSKFKMQKALLRPLGYGGQAKFKVSKISKRNFW